MYIIKGKRGEGKTASLLACADYEKGIAVVLNKKYAEQLAKYMNLYKVKILSYKDFLNLYDNFKNFLSKDISFFIDELPILLDFFDIHIETGEIYNPSTLPILFENKFSNIKLQGYSYTQE